MAKTIVVKQVGSPIRRPKEQRATLVGLGLNKMHKTRELEDTPSVRGMVNKIPHLVEIIEEKGCPRRRGKPWPTLKTPPGPRGRGFLLRALRTVKQAS